MDLSVLIKCKLLFDFQIEQDFKILYPDAEEKLYEKWNDVSEKLLTYIQKVVPTWKTHMQDEDFVLEDLTSGIYIFINVWSKIY